MYREGHRMNHEPKSSSGEENRDVLWRGEGLWDRWWLASE
jgi:hypothetical protein